MEQWLIPTLATTYPGIAWVVRWLLVSYAVELVGVVALGLAMIRAAPRLQPQATAHLRDVTRGLAKARAAIIVGASAMVALWIVGSAAFGVSAERNEVLLVLPIGVFMLPAYVIITILSKTMSWAADIANRNTPTPKG